MPIPISMAVPGSRPTMDRIPNSAEVGWLRKTSPKFCSRVTKPLISRIQAVKKIASDYAGLVTRAFTPKKAPSLRPPVRIHLHR